MVHVKTGTTFTGPAPVPPPVPGDTVVTEQAFGQASAAGALATFSREDHTHGTPAAPAAGGGHLGCGGGTLIGGVPLYNYEDHDLFNTSWCWRLLATNSTDFDWGRVGTSALGGGGPRPIFHTMTGQTCDVASGTNSPMTGPGQFDCIRNSTEFYLNQTTPQVTFHMMVKAFEIIRWNDDKWSTAIGFWQINRGIEYTLGTSNKGIGFGYSTEKPAIFLNPNWYAIASSDNTFTKIKVKDTGFPIATTNTIGPKHKFSVHVEKLQATFYIDNILVSTITAAECVANEWPVNLRTFPTAGVNNLRTTGTDTMGYRFQYPIIAGASIGSMPP